jgi:hypothetical protein
MSEDIRNEKQCQWNLKMNEGRDCQTPSRY